MGQVIAIRGTVEYISPGVESAVEGPGGVKKVSIKPWQKASFNQKIFPKDQFRTRQGSRLKILFSDNSLISLGPNSTMKVDSYLYKPKDKLRQGVISIVHGITMYIVNKSQKHKNSSFQIKTPTANISARGTQVYTSATSTRTLVANQAGHVLTKNINPAIQGQQAVGPMIKIIIEKGKPPFKPVPLSKSELKQIRNVILGRIGTSSKGIEGEKPLIEEEEKDKPGETEKTEITEEPEGTEEIREVLPSMEGNTEALEPVEDFDTTLQQIGIRGLQMYFFRKSGLEHLKISSQLTILSIQLSWTHVYDIQGGRGSTTKCSHCSNTTNKTLLQNTLLQDCSTEQV